MSTRNTCNPLKDSMPRLRANGRSAKRVFAATKHFRTHTDGRAMGRKRIWDSLFARGIRPRRGPTPRSLQLKIRGGNERLRRGFKGFDGKSANFLKARTAFIQTAPNPLSRALHIPKRRRDHGNFLRASGESGGPIPFGARCFGPRLGLQTSITAKYD